MASRKSGAGKRRVKKTRRATVKDLDVEGKDIKGGATPTPGGPVPIPYPNLTAAEPAFERDEADPVLLPFLEAADDESARRRLGELLEREASPLAWEVIRGHLRGPAKDDLEDVHAGVLLSLAAHLRALRARGASEPPIRDFAGYVAVVAHNACHAFLRERSPQRARLRSRTRYVLTRDPRLAMWEGERARVAVRGLAFPRGGAWEPASAARLAEVSAAAWRRSLSRSRARRWWRACRGRRGSTTWSGRLAGDPRYLRRPAGVDPARRRTTPRVRAKSPTPRRRPTRRCTSGLPGPSLGRDPRAAAAAARRAAPQPARRRRPRDDRPLPDHRDGQRGRPGAGPRHARGAAAGALGRPAPGRRMDRRLAGRDAAPGDQPAQVRARAAGPAPAEGRRVVARDRSLHSSRRGPLSGRTGGAPVMNATRSGSSRRSSATSCGSPMAEAPSFDELAAYVEGRLDPEERAPLEERLAADPALRQEVEDLRELHAQMARPRPRDARAGSLRRLAVLAAALAAVAAWSCGSPAADDARSRRPRRPPAARRHLERRRREAGPCRRWSLAGFRARRGTRRGRGGPARRAARAAGPRVAPVRAGGPSWGPERRRLSRPVTPGHARERGPADVPLDGASRARQLRGRGVRPGPAEARSPAARSPAPSGRRPRPLARGRTYLWQVTAVTGGRARHGAGAPRAGGALRGRGSGRAGRGGGAGARTAPASHLVAAVAFVEAGLLDDADAELRALAADNPGSPEVARLRESLVALRRQGRSPAVTRRPPRGSSVVALVPGQGGTAPCPRSSPARSRPPCSWPA